MFDHHALGLAGRAGGVDDVGQVPWRQAQRLRVQVSARLCRPGRRVGVEQQARYRRRAVGEARGQPALYQQHRRGAVGQHVGQSFLGIGRVQRHVGAAGLENGQQADDHVRPALGADRDPVVGADPQTAQMVRQLVGFDVKLGVAQPAAVPYQGIGLGCLQRLRLKQFVGAAVLGIVGLGGVPAVQHLATLGLADHRQTGDGLAVVRHHAGQQGLPVAQVTGDGVLVKQRRGIFETADDGVAVFLQRKAEVELGAGARHVHRRQAEAGQAQFPAGRVLPVEHDLEQRGMREATRRLHDFDDLFERDVLVGLGIEGLDLDAFDQGRDRG